MPKRLAKFVLLMSLPLCCTTGAAHAGVFRDIGFGLGLAGFELQGNHNILSGGDNFRISNNFVGVPLDAGIADLSLQGPISLSISTGERGLSTLDLSLRTALDTATAAIPLGFIFNADVGSQQTQITGSLLIDANLSINGFGFYDLNLIYSLRETVDNDGSLSVGSANYDLDIGPVDISGNIFADMLKAITDPVFAAVGVDSPFAAFMQGPDLLSLLTPGGLEELAEFSLSNPATAGDPFAPLDDLLGKLDGDGVDGATSRSFLDGSLSVVPEPTVILLMLLGVPVLILGHRGRLRLAK